MIFAIYSFDFLSTRPCATHTQALWFLVFVMKFQATSAFDGLQSSKWEEPDGAKGIKIYIVIISCIIC